MGDDAVKIATGYATKATQESVRSKLLTYLLDSTHPTGKSKATWFKQALGFTKDNIDELASQIVFDQKKAVMTTLTEHGQKFQQVIEITGANGKKIEVTFYWIKNNDGVIRLITSIPSPQ